MTFNSIDNFPFSIKKYLKKIPKHFHYPICGINDIDKYYSNIIIIPIFSEYKYIFKTLKMLSTAIDFAKNSGYGDTLIILSINNPKDDYDSKALSDSISDNQKLLKVLNNTDDYLSGNKSEFPSKVALDLMSNFSIGWIDASSEGCELRKEMGVGGGRKIGMDSALFYSNWEKDTLLFSLDADTIVEENYITAIRDYFDNNRNKSAAVVRFVHQKGKTDDEEKAIRLYEDFLNNYVANLRKSQTPYAYHSIGSAIICRATYYVKAGGMRARAAAEDFYFLQALCKVGPPLKPIGEILETTIYPSARTSDRVPFGTGPKVAKYSRETQNIDNLPIFYNPKIFKILNILFDFVEKNLTVLDIDIWMSQLPKDIIDFLEIYQFEKNWVKIVNNTPRDPIKIKWAFYTWFDAFRILKFIHYCEDDKLKYPKQSRVEINTEM